MNLCRHHFSDPIGTIYQASFDSAIPIAHIAITVSTLGTWKYSDATSDEYGRVC